MAAIPKMRRIITGHNADGKAVFLADELLTPADPTKDEWSPPSLEATVGYTTIDRTDGIPAKLQNPPEEYRWKKISLVEQDSVTCRVVDFLPLPETGVDLSGFMHRTQSLDYAICLSGSIQCILDDDVEKTLNAGDVLLQRATIHAWKNISKEICRVLFVLMPAVPFTVEKTGESLLPVHITGLSGQVEQRDDYKDN